MADRLTQHTSRVLVQYSEPYLTLLAACTDEGLTTRHGITGIAYKSWLLGSRSCSGTFVVQDEQVLGFRDVGSYD